MNFISRFRFMRPSRRLSVFLYLVAAHSFIVGLLLVIQPPALMRMMGFGIPQEPFFPCQGGVFHVLMAIAYIYGAVDLRANRNLVIFAVIVKLAAAGFLFSYYFFMEPLMVVLLSGAVDLGMGVAIWGLLVKITNYE